MYIRLLFLFSFFVQFTFASNPANLPKGFISGIVIDSISKSPIEYASVVLYSALDKEIVNGVITKPDGSFKLPQVDFGTYYLEISFLSYQTKTISSIRLSKNKTHVSVGEIQLSVSAKALAEIEITANNNAIEYQIDKKVIHVSEQHTSISGTAVDVLESAPSVNVDIEGNVSLRGSSGFTVLIDGRPSVLDANEALQQIPASTIQDIEIITNPSAKYDPDGTAGIINIITKKSKFKGVSGLVNLNGGMNNKYGGDFLLNYRSEKINTFISANYNRRDHTGLKNASSWTSRNDTTSYIVSGGENTHSFTNYNIKAGFEYFIDTNDVISLNVRLGTRDMNSFSDNNYEEWNNVDYDSHKYLSVDNGGWGGNYYSVNSNYQHKFAKKGHELTAEFMVRGGSFMQTSESSLIELNTIVDSKRSTEDGPHRRIRLKADYTLPLRKKDKFEAGFQSRIGRSSDINELHIYNPTTLLYTFQPDYSHYTTYLRNIHSVYSLYSGEVKKFGYQLGLRTEFTDREIEIAKLNKTFSIDRFDLFPTLHFSYNFPKEFKLMTSYARRIDRPKGWFLEPFPTWTDAYNVRQGNADLKPEYIDSYELGFLKSLGKNYISFETYYRITSNKVERVRSVYDENIFLHSIENVGTDYSFGSEFMLSYNLLKWWKADLSGNLYSYKIEGVLYNQAFSRHSLNWNTRLNSTFKINKTLIFQLNGSYVSKSVIAQGTFSGFFMTNASLKKDFMNKQLSAILQVSDVFGTGLHEHTNEGVDFYSYSKYLRESPVVMLSIKYRFNNYKPERRSMNRDSMGEDDF